MTEILAMKIYCDIYLLTVAVRTVQNKLCARLVRSMENVTSSENSADELRVFHNKSGEKSSFIAEYLKRKTSQK